MAGKAFLEIAFSQEIDEDGIHCLIDIDGIEISEVLTVSWKDLVETTLINHSLIKSDDKHVFDSSSAKDILSYSKALISAGEQIQEILKNSKVFDSESSQIKGLLDQSIHPYEEWILNSNSKG